MSPKIFGVGSGKTAASVSRQIYIPDISRHDQADNSCCRLERLIREVDGAARKECRVAQNVGVVENWLPLIFQNPCFAGSRRSFHQLVQSFPFTYLIGSSVGYSRQFAIGMSQFEPRWRPSASCARAESLRIEFVIKLRQLSGFTL